MSLAMTGRLAFARTRLRPFFQLAVPMAIAQLGQMGMALIDMAMVGRLGPAALAGVGLANAFLYLFALFGAGTMFALDYLVSHAQGREDWKDSHHWLFQGLYLALGLSAIMVVAIEAVGPWAMHAWFAPALAEPATAFLQTMTLSLPGFLLFVTLRQFLQATGSPRAGTLVTTLALGSNLLFNWIFIFGHAGAPTMGVAGAGLATTVTRTWMVLSLAGFLLWRDQKQQLGLARVPKTPSLTALKQLLALGIPTGLHMGLECLIFSLVAFLVGRIGAVPSASHTLVVNISAFTYMVPMAMSGAAAVLVGQASGARQPAEARSIGWLAIGVGAAVMGAMGLLLAGFGAPLAAIFSSDPAVVKLGTQLLGLVALFQVADGLQTVGGGALRGLGNTRSVLWANLIGYWAIGLPVGYWLGMVEQRGAYGFWIGLTVGLYAVAAFIVFQWVAMTRRAARGEAMQIVAHAEAESEATNRLAGTRGPIEHGSP